MNKTTILEAKVKELKTKGVMNIHEGNKSKDKNKTKDTTTNGLQPENVNDTASHTNKIKCDVCSKD